LNQAGYYVSDLIGLRCFLNRAREIGRIEDVQFGAGEAPLLIVCKRRRKKVLKYLFAESVSWKG